MLFPETETVFANFVLLVPGLVMEMEGCLFVQHHPALGKGSGTWILQYSLLRKVVEHFVAFLRFLW